VSGKISFISYLISLISIFGAIYDFKWGKIFNWFTLPVMLSGMFMSAFFFGWAGFYESVLGFLLGLVLYGSLFGLRMVGGGDVKFLMALGAWGGIHYTIEVAILGICVGGVFSLFHLTSTGRIFDFTKRMYFFVLSIFIRELEFQFPKLDKTKTFPFGISIAIAAIWVEFFHPFEAWGPFSWF
jgi:prepilin peptidase CpaA